MEPTVQQASQHLFEYGLLGILAFLLGYFAWSSYNKLEKKNDELEKKLDVLQEEMMDILSDERDRMADLVQKNTAAITELSRIILEYVVEKRHQNPSL
jgi:hypothetical protein